MDFAQLDSSAVKVVTHPFLFFPPDRIRISRERYADSRYQDARKELEKESDAAMTLELPVFETKWWDEEASKKPWGEIYPEISEHTTRVPLLVSGPALACAHRWMVSGDERFLRRAKDLLLHLGTFSFKFEHYDVGMNYSISGLHALMVYDALFEHLSSVERETMDGYFTRLGKAVLLNDGYWIENVIGGGINNHLAWHKMALGLLGAFYGKHEWIEHALHGPRSISELLELGLVDDGLWCESSLLYHFVAFIPMMFLGDALRNIGYSEDLFTQRYANERTLKQAFDAIFDTLFPNRAIPPIGDAYARNTLISEQRIYESAFAAWGDPRYAWVLEGAPYKRGDVFFLAQPEVVPQAPEVGPRLFPEHGYAFLRSRKNKEYWGTDAWCAFLNYDRSGVHCNQDGLSLMVFGKGRLLTPDVEARATVYHAFSSRVQGELNRSTFAQNTVMVDGRDQGFRVRRLRLMDWRILPDEQVVAAADLDGMIYPGVRQQRTAILREEYLLDVFELVSDAAHTFDWIQHTFGTLDHVSISFPLTPGDGGEERTGPRKWLKAHGAGKPDGDFRMEAKEEGVRLRLSMLGNPGTFVRIEEFPRVDDASQPGFPMLTVRREGRNAVFTCLYQAERGDIPDARLERHEDQNGHMLFHVSGPWGVRKHLVKTIEGSW